MNWERSQVTSMMVQELVLSSLFSKTRRHFHIRNEENSTWDFWSSRELSVLCGPLVPHESTSLGKVTSHFHDGTGACFVLSLFKDEKTFPY